MTNAPLKLLVINSSSASGSTLFDALLGSQPGVCTLGEIGALGRSLSDNDVCGCGMPLSTCPVWSSVPNKLLDLIQQNELEQRLKSSLFIVRWYHYFYMILRGGRRSSDPIVRRYARKMRDLLDCYINIQQQETDERVLWLVDATKSHWHLQWLHASGLFDIRVIHLVKDPRAYVHSMDKAYANAKRNQPEATRSAFRLAYRWLSANLAILILHRSCWTRESRRFIRYDDLSVNYEETIRGICAWLGTQFDSERAARFRIMTNHAIGGNRMRRESRPVQIDTEWASKLDKSRSLFVWMVTWPLAKFFGVEWRTELLESRE